MNTPNPTQVVTGLVRFSFLQIWEPKSMNDDPTAKKKYSMSILVPKGDAATLAKIKKAINEAVLLGVGKKWGGKKPATLKMPVRDGDKERPGDEVYAGHYFINATANMQPGIIDKDKNEILIKSDVYSGCYGRVDINFYPFNEKGNKGIACGLNNVQKIKDGKALGGARNAMDAFDDDFIFEDDGATDFDSEEF